MSYNPREPHVINLLSRALSHVQGVAYNVTARWVFYRLLQDGSLDKKGDYKRLLGYLSKARKNFYDGWTPYTLTDDSRAAVVNGGGFVDGRNWVDAMAEQSSCTLDRWPTQDSYVEVWFEAAAMSAQFQHYADPNITLLAFHGDISIPAKWDAAERLVRRWIRDPKPIYVLYYGDLDPKGEQIPESARRDVETMMYQSFYQQMRRSNPGEAMQLLDDFHYERIGLNEDQIDQYGVQENPERPGTYQWEGVPDDAAEELIGRANAYVDQDAIAEIEEEENRVTRLFRNHLEDLDVSA